MKSIPNLLSRGLAASVFLMASGFASATVIDFTDAIQWGGASGQSFPSNGVILSAFGTLPVFGTPTAANLTFNAGPCNAVSSLGFACQGAGIGINRPLVPNGLLDVPGEIDRRETLLIDLGGTFLVSSIEFLNVQRDLVINEAMSIAFDGGPWQNFTVSSPAAGGYFSPNFAAVNASTIAIRGGGSAAFSVQEGSLARITYVPVPATLALFVIGFTAFAVTRKRS